TLCRGSWSRLCEQSLANFAICGGVDGSPGHGQSAIEDRFVGHGRHAKCGEFRLVDRDWIAVETDYGVDRWHGLGDVPHVCRDGICAALSTESAAIRLEVCPVEAGEARVMDHLGVGLFRLDVPCAAGGNGAGFKAAHHF